MLEPGGFMALRSMVAAWLALAIAVPHIAIAQSPTDDFTRAAFAAADVNDDGLVDEAEFVNDAIVGFVAADGDSDRVVMASDLDPADRAEMATVDADADGRVTFSEVMDMKLEQFRAADTDGDGALTLDEALAYDRSN
jgi:hypothetical protein